jgi:V8-like Glu-specific endopeptidase
MRPVDFEDDYEDPQSADLAVVGPLDNRVQEVRTTQFPWNTVVHLCRDFGTGNCSGCSGMLIGPRHVLTAGHCLYSLKRKASPRTIRVLPGRSDRKTLPYGSFPAQHWYLPRAFVRGPDRVVNDWGLIVLRDPVTRLRQFMSLHAASDRELAWLTSHGKLTIAGYPADRPVGTMWRHTEKLRRVSPKRLFYTVDTCPGHSGSAILARLPAGPRIVGIHTAGLLDEQGRTFGCNRATVLAPSGSLNSGIRLTAAMMQALRNPAAAVSDGTLVRYP